MFQKNSSSMLILILFISLFSPKANAEGEITKAIMVEACIQELNIGESACRSLIRQIRGPGCNGINGLYNHCLRSHGSGKGRCTKQMIELIGILKVTFCSGLQP